MCTRRTLKNTPRGGEGNDTLLRRSTKVKENLGKSLRNQAFWRGIRTDADCNTDIPQPPPVKTDNARSTMPGLEPTPEACAGMNARHMRTKASHQPRIFP